MKAIVGQSPIRGSSQHRDLKISGGVMQLARQFGMIRRFIGESSRLPPLGIPQFVFFGVLLLASCTLSAASAFDSAADPAYSNGWADGIDGGQGWGAGWSYLTTHSSDGALFIGTSPTGGGPAWGVLSGSASPAMAFRQLPTPLQVGQAISVDIYNGAPSSGSTRIGWQLDPDITQGGYNPIFDTTAFAGYPNYGVNIQTTPVPVNDLGMRFTLTLTSPTAYRYAFTPIEGGTAHVITGSFTPQSTRKEFLGLYAWYNGSTTSTAAYFNNIAIYTPPPIQNIVLNFNQQAPFAVSVLNNGFFSNAKEALFTRGTTSTIPIDAATQVSILQRVQAIFAASGVTNVNITTSPVSGPATNVYFADLALSPSLAPNQVLLGLGDTDRFNTNPAGRAIVYLNPQQPDIELTAKDVAHEVGHTLGLPHMPALPIPDVMTQGGVTAGVLPTFKNMIRSIPDRPGETSNTQYHLLRYVDGVPDSLLQNEGIFPGSWDKQGITLFGVHLQFNGVDRTLYNVDVLSKDLSSNSIDGPDGDGVSSLAHFDIISLSQLSGMEFDLTSEDSLQLLGASSANAVGDVALIAGNPTDPDNLSLAAMNGTIDANLVQGSLTQYNVLNTASVSFVSVPEPFVLWVVAAISTCLWRSRRNSSAVVLNDSRLVIY